ncbi:uncharacterized protein ACWYII_014689 [Salvelinus alpinus]
MEILLKDFDAPVKRLRACLQSSQEDNQELEDMKKQWDIRAGEMEAFHLQLQERVERIQKLKAVWGLMEPLKEHHGGDARISSATNTQSTDFKSEENIEIEVTVMKDATLLKASAAEHALAVEKNETALLCQRIVQLTSKKLKIGIPGFLIKNIPKRPKTSKTNKPFLKTCKVLKAFKALFKR